MSGAKCEMPAQDFTRVLAARRPAGRGAAAQVEAVEGRRRDPWIKPGTSLFQELSQDSSGD